MICISGYAHYEISDGNLLVKGIYRRTITINSITNKDIKIGDLKELGEFSPYLRTNGIGFPGYYEGRFRLKNGEKCILLIRTKDKKTFYMPAINNFLDYP
jgi:PH (Pleckstrin Homology) domain-containing protein